MALTTEQYTRLRDLTGGRTTSNDRDHLTDVELQDEYDEAGTWAQALVGVLKRRIGMAARFVDKSMDVNSESLAQYVEHLRDLLKEAEDTAGVGGATLSVGVIDLNIDTDYSDLPGAE